jgi:hypothetical protein
MADTTTVSPNRIHWILYPALGAVVLLLLWAWHDTQVRDAALVQAVATAKTSQATADKQATGDIAQATQNLQKQNTDLQNSLQKAKTTAQQIALINQQAGTHLQVQAQPPTPQATDPSQPSVVITPVDVQTIAKQTVDFKEAQNQVAADKIVIASKDVQIEARDTTIAAQTKEITTLKGGSHLKRFLTATKHIVIGAVIGVAIDEVVRKK